MDLVHFFSCFSLTFPFLSWSNVLDGGTTGFPYIFPTPPVRLRRLLDHSARDITCGRITTHALSFLFMSSLFDHTGSGFTNSLLHSSLHSPLHIGPHTALD